MKRAFVDILLQKGWINTSIAKCEKNCNLTHERNYLV